MPRTRPTGMLAFAYDTREQARKVDLIEQKIISRENVHTITAEDDRKLRKQWMREYAALQVMRRAH